MQRHVCINVETTLYKRHVPAGILQKIEKTSLNQPYLLPDLALWVTLSGSDYPCTEHISTVQKMFEPLKIGCYIQTPYLG